MVLAQRALTAFVVGCPPGSGISLNRRKRLTGGRAEPEVWSHVELRRYLDPQNAAARLSRERRGDRNSAGLCRGAGLELDVPYDCTAPHYKVVAMCIELRAQHLDIHHAS